ncbi:MAG: YqhA family protein [Sulfuricurvum sp.]|uniref:YqhA family protein n=1 Tax=Sulfuricurvum sp. TaxID=2025608 RepID=UPI00260EFF41|nr:YqhA family protein [Sulfuricurvum sp.]MDD2370233.1 YqhA family protein [Sulfuricurvum sp.]MDD2949992.1 YqhA family protein [Sulfuricurvum sp.]MDD5117458.1 YqhA family protein [Sulfuricurvum sp.]
MNLIEKIFEHGLWNSRFIIVLAVIFGLVGAVLLFAIASIDIFQTAGYVINTYATHAHPEHFHEEIVGGIIGAVDLYLIGVVMIIFSFGLYELFISDIDPAKDEDGKENQLLAVHSLDQLKDKISKVIVMVLVVGFFQKVGHTVFTGALELFYLALSITAVAVGLYFLSKVGHHE